MTRNRFVPSLILFCALWPVSGWSGGFLDPSSFPDVTAILSPPVVAAFVKSIGLTTEHRPYEPATPLGKKGIDLSIEATLCKIPPEFATATAAIGATDAGSIPFLPVPRINLHKGMGERSDLGLSYIRYTNFVIWGLDFKVVVAEPEEGPTWALRLNFTSSSFDVTNGSTISISTKTYTPQLLFSRRLDFADPYMGVGYQMAFGDVTVTVPTINYMDSRSGEGAGFMAFTGVGMQIPQLGFKLTLEGTYSPAGAHTIGTKIGFVF